MSSGIEIIALSCATSLLAAGTIARFWLCAARAALRLESDHPDDRVSIED
ncbi:hypothetical protein ACWF50_11760 [Brucella pseudogrignonensis]|jgi:hypothetical protein